MAEPALELHPALPHHALTHRDLPGMHKDIVRIFQLPRMFSTRSCAVRKLRRWRAVERPYFGGR